MTGKANQPLMTTEELLRAFSQMTTIRRFEDTVWEIYPRGEIPVSPISGSARKRWPSASVARSWDR